MNGIGLYHPQNKVHNDFFIQHFKTLDLEVEGLLRHLERENRYLSDDKDETVITMAHKASLLAIEDTDISVDDIDMVIFATDTPEYTSPSNAIKLCHWLKVTNAKTVYDTNSNCIGMLTALDQAFRIMQTNRRIKKALIVGSLLISSVTRPDDTITYPHFGDSAAAVVLEGVDEESKRGFIDSTTFTDPSYHDTIRMPDIGYSKITRDDIQNDLDKKWNWVPFDTSFLPGRWSTLIKEVLHDNHLTPQDINHYIFSQFSNPDAKKALDKLGIAHSKLTYVGNEYGYTGVTSPIFALDRALTTGKIKEHANIILCSVGSGYSIISLLYQF